MDGSRSRSPAGGARRFEPLEQPSHRRRCLFLGSVEARGLVVRHHEAHSLDGGRHERRRELLPVDPVLVEDGVESFDLHPAHLARECCRLRLERRSVIRGGGQLDEQRIPAQVGHQSPPRAERLGRGECIAQQGDAALAVPANDGDEEIDPRGVAMVSRYPGDPSAQSRSDQGRLWGAIPNRSLAALTILLTGPPLRHRYPGIG